MDSKTGEIMSAAALVKAERAMQELTKKEAEELIPLHLEDRLERMQHKAREREQRNATKHALKNSR